MTRILRLLGALAFVACTCPAALAQEVRLRVMTFNVVYDWPDDAPNRWALRKEAVAKMIQASGAAIVCIQEDKEDQVADLKGLLPDYAFVGRGRNATGSGEHCSILYLKKNLALVESGTIWLSQTPDEAGSMMPGDDYPRIATWAMLRTGGGRKILVLSTHFTDGDHEPMRKDQAGVLHGWLARQLGLDRPGERVPFTVVVAGDYNSAAADGEVHPVLTRGDRIGLRDAWDEAKPSGMPGTYNGWEGMTTKKRIDWILVGGPARINEAGKFEEKVDGRYPSDHYPVWADLAIR